MGFITKDDSYFFGQGTHYEIYKKLGAHPVTYRKKKGFYFAVWAPHAEAVSVVGEFNRWDPDENPCKPVLEDGIWETFIPGLMTGELYKFAIRTQKGELLFKADPYARGAEFRPGTASRLEPEPWDYVWGDEAWMNKRTKEDPRRRPLSIYECHPGSWKKADRP